MASLPCIVDIRCEKHKHEVSSVVGERLIADLERMEQDGIYGGRRNGSRVRDRYAPALHEGDEEEAIRLDERDRKIRFMSPSQVSSL
jgi:hypothetical protein